jgi:exodeoxyribonuclease X
MNNYLILDTETTGLNGSVCEIAWVTMDEDLNILDQHETLVDPEREIEPGAFAIHGISKEMCAGKPTLAEVAKLLPTEGWLIGHNVGFDCRMIAGAYVPAATLCSLALSRKYVKGTTNHKLATLQKELNLPDRKSHSALGDILTVHDLLKHILPMTGVGLPDLFARASAPKMLHTMPFGKHRGMQIMKVPKDYRDWLLGQGNLDQDLKYTLEKLKDV